MSKWIKHCPYCSAPKWEGDRNSYFQCGTRVKGYMTGVFLHKWIPQRDTQTDRCKEIEFETKVRKIFKKIIEDSIEN